MRTLRCLFGLGTALLSAPAFAEYAAPSFWRVLVRPHAHWELSASVLDEGVTADQVVVETYDVRRIADADVARLRWTHVTTSGGKTERSSIGDSDRGKYTQLAVTTRGLYILDADQTDAQIAEALKRKPSRSDPPRAYKATKKNHGRYLTRGSNTACMGEEPLPGAGDCDDVCEAEMCMSAESGIVSLSGFWAPGGNLYE